MTEPRRNILVVEDNEANQMLARAVLELEGYAVEIAGSVAEAFDVLGEHRPDLILMDVQLPKLSGLDATRLLRADPRTAKIPLVVVTSFALSGDDRRAIDAGASAYLAKPYSPRDLMALINRFLPGN